MLCCVFSYIIQEYAEASPDEELDRQNWHIYILSAVLLVFVLSMLWAIFKDKMSKGNNGVLRLADNIPGK